MAAHCTGFKKRPSEEPTSLALELPRHRALLMFLPSFSFFFLFFLSVFFIQDKGKNAPKLVYYSRQVYYLFIAVLCACLEVWPLTELAAGSDSLHYSLLGKGQLQEDGILEEAQSAASRHPPTHCRH